MSGFKFDAKDFLEKLAENGEINKKMRAAVEIYCDANGKKMAGRAKIDAPWKDRTGNARQTIEGGAKWKDPNTCISYVAGNMNYSPYLELAHADKKGDDVNIDVSPSFSQLELGNEGKYAVLRPTIRKCTPDFMAGMANLLGK